MKDDAITPRTTPPPPGITETGRDERYVDRDDYEQYEKDKSHLRLISIFYFIIAALNLIGLVLSPIYIVLGVVFLAAGDPTLKNGPPPAMGYLFIALGLFAATVSGLYAYLLYLTGRSLRENKRRTLCIVMAALLCASPPAGTALGVFTLIVLMRPSVKDLFEHGSPELYGGRDD